MKNKIKPSPRKKTTSPWNTLPCIVCKKALTSAFAGNGGSEIPPQGAAVFHAPGNYGSVVFEPMDGQYLEINICDDCLKKAAKKGFVALGYKTSPLRLWRPGLENELSVHYRN